MGERRRLPRENPAAGRLRVDCAVPYRIEVTDPNAIDHLVELGALDVDAIPGGLAALMPDCVSVSQVARVLGLDRLAVLPAIGRDDDSVWVLQLRAIRVGRLHIVPADDPIQPGAIRLADSRAFGTGLHATTALCLEALQQEVRGPIPNAVLDVGTGTGVLALAALALGVPRALGIDIDEEALRAASEHARLNGVSDRFEVARGGPESVSGLWPLVLANVLAAPLIEMAPAIARRLGHDGRLVLSGIRASLEEDVARAYVRQGMRRVLVLSRDAWVALILQASW